MIADRSLQAVARIPSAHLEVGEEDLEYDNGTFSANGKNSAKNTTATFPGPGRYTFHVTISDRGGLIATSSIAIQIKAPMALSGLRAPNLASDVAARNMRLSVPNTRIE